MAIITKYEKIDAAHIRKWTYDETILFKGDMQNERAKYNNILNMNEEEKQILADRLGFPSTETYDLYFQAKQDELDILIDLFNNTTTEQEIEFLNP